MATAQIAAFFDNQTSTFSYVVHAGLGSACAIIDPVLDYDPLAARTSTMSADRIAAFVGTNDLKLEWLLETHAHADHLSSAAYLRSRLGGKIAIGDYIRAVQDAFNPIFGLQADGARFDYLFSANENFTSALCQRKPYMSPNTHRPIWLI